MRKHQSMFDRKFGENFLSDVPLSPGVYQMLDAQGKVVYVGKAKLLRRRLQQYRNAKRCKKHHKMRAILNAATCVIIKTCATHLDAVLLENELIRTLRPQFNIAGAFSFLYPMIGVKRDGHGLAVVYTTSPTSFAGFEFYGAYRSRFITREGFLALAELLEFVGHRESYKALKQYPRIRFSHLAAYRQISDQWMTLLDSFFRGASIELLQALSLTLLEKPTARRRAEEIEEDLHALKRFFRHEAKALRKVLKDVGLETQKSISQEERDRLFLISRDRRDAKCLSSPRSALSREAPQADLGHADRPIPAREVP